MASTDNISRQDKNDENERFGSLTTEQIRQKEKEMENKNSVKNEKKAVDAFKYYLKQIRYRV